MLHQDLLEPDPLRHLPCAPGRAREGRVRSGAAGHDAPAIEPSPWAQAASVVGNALAGGVLLVALLAAPLVLARLMPIP